MSTDKRFEYTHCLELIDEDDPEVFEFNKTFVKALHKLGVSAQEFLDAWTETIDESNKRDIEEVE